MFFPILGLFLLNCVGSFYGGEEWLMLGKWERGTARQKEIYVTDWRQHLADLLTVKLSADAHT